MISLKYYGHSCFQLTQERISLLFDPFLSDNPFKIATPSEIECTHILVSHGHFDHLGDAVQIAKRTGATIISTAEIAGMCAEQGCQAHKMHIGGKHTFEFGYVRVTPAFHGAGAPGGHACGFIVNFFGKTFYHTGDTGIFGDMQLLGRLESIDCALLPIGDNFTMGPDDAVEAAGMLKPKLVIPMHYNTWPLIAQDPYAFKAKTESVYNIPVQVIAPGETFSF
ncbi:MAG: metal-dependent hydrolase [Negativicutes bacterium]|nr:metal-dependent hydrolase [Negativicutes bacterium]